MENNALLSQEAPQGADQLVRLTALLYLREALASQDFESCPDLIDTAKKLGVQHSEISGVIKDYLNEDDKVTINRLAPTKGG